MDGYGMIPELNSFANQYDATLYGEQHGSFRTPGLLNQERNEQYSQPAIAQAFAQIKSQWSFTNTNPMYSLIGDGKQLIQSQEMIVYQYFLTMMMAADMDGREDWQLILQQQDRIIRSTQRKQKCYS